MPSGAGLSVDDAPSLLRRFLRSRVGGAVVESAPHAGGHAVVLDQSLFYPSSGGQPFDTGRLGGVAVVDVSVREADGAVLHLLEKPLESAQVEGRIDWSRRFDHMQQHTGQHILSQAFERVAGAATIGFHLGVERVTIDLAAELSEATIAKAESLANQIVSADTRVRAWFPEPEELRSLALRKQPEVRGPVRVVAIDDFDVSACGGTHVAAAGEVGLIAVLRAERLKRGARIEFVCGGRARSDYARKHAIVRELATTLTCAPAELTGSVARLQDSLQAARRELAILHERELDAEAAVLFGSGENRGGMRIVRAAWADRPVDQVKGLAQRLTARPGTVTLLGVAGSPSQLIFGRSEELAIDLKPAFNRTLTALGGGRGGGARLLQGAAAPASLDTVERALTAAQTSLPGTA